MSWNVILGHDRTKKILQRAILEKKIANAYLLWGIEGIGKDALAFEFAKTVNCYSPIIQGDAVYACDECKSCKQASNFSHPNIQYIFSLPAGKGSDKSESAVNKLSDEQIDEIKEQLSLKSENIYHKVALPNATQIRIASIRDIKKNLSLTANTKGRRFVVISSADEMTGEAANAFLKTLEEPHENITIILSSSKKEALLQTILSRCQQIHCDPIPDEILTDTLVQRYSLNLADAKVVATFAQGSFTKAIEYMEGNVQELRAEVIEMFRCSLKKNTYRIELLEYIDKFTSSNDKNLYESIIKLLLFWMRDVYTYSMTRNDDAIINIDQKDRIAKFIELFPHADIPKAIRDLEITASKIRRNVNPKLSLINLFISIRANFLGISS